jgi:hypothetical protein
MEKIRRIRASPSLLLGCACLVLHALANGHYGIFRDELYYIVCGERPDWGYVDHPAIVPLLAAWSHAIFGNSVWGFRLIPALVMAITVMAATDFARALGGGRLAQWLTGLCVLLAPIFLLEGLIFISDLFQPLTWLGLGWVLLQLERTDDERWWLAFGAIAGFSLNTKYLIAFYVLALGVGLMATPRRKSLLRPWLYLGALLAIVMILPNLLWQQAHGWPFIEFGKGAAGGKDLALSPLAYLLQQVVFSGPAATAVWLCGLWACLVHPRLRIAPAFAIAWLILLFTFDLSHGKAYYLLPLYPTLLAFGAVRVENWISHAVARGAVLSGVVLLGAATLPFALPILPVDVFVRYEQAIGLVPSVGERQQTSALPQYYADMFGWREMAEKVAAIYKALPPADRARAVFFGQNYGEAAAIDVLGRDLGLPAAISGHNNYYLWGPRGADGSVVIIVGGSKEHYESLFQSVEVAGRTASGYAMPYEADQPIYVLRGMKQPLGDYWPQAKHFE